MDIWDMKKRTSCMNLRSGRDSSMHICMIGTGYVGLVTGTCLAEVGHSVWCVDVDGSKIERLKNGEIPIYEPGLEDMVSRNVRQGRLRFTTDLKEALDDSPFVFIAVGTPPGEDGSADLRYVLDAARQIGSSMDDYKIVVVKSTVPVGTTEKARLCVSEELGIRGRDDLDFDVAFCPEFLKEGSAIDDFMSPDRVVIGTDNQKTADLLGELFSAFSFREDRIIFMSIPSAELTKYASNSMLATRISFMNQLARFCEKIGADIDQVRHGMGSDGRIGSAFLYPGVGYGGSCFPKDVKALIHSGRSHGVPMTLLESVEEINKSQRKWFFDKILSHYGADISGKTFAVWGLSFKPNTDDIREAPALDIIPWLLEKGASVRAYDPVGQENAKAELPNTEDIVYCDDNYQALENADALILLTEWLPFRRPEFDRMKDLMGEHVIFDGRNQYRPDRMADLGFVYYGIGRYVP